MAAGLATIALVGTAVGGTGRDARAGMTPTTDDATGSGTNGAVAPLTILVHVTHGPEHPTRAALAFAVARAALRQGHAVTVFLAGDAVQLLREGVRDELRGLGTGELGALFDEVRAGGARLYASGGSSRARGLPVSELEALGVQPAAPDELVRLAVASDRMFTY